MRELKKEAKKIIRERIGLSILGFLLIYILPIVLPALVTLGFRNLVSYSLSTAILFITLLVVNSIAMIGKCYFSLNLAKRSEKTSLLNLLFGFKKFYKAIAISLIVLTIVFVSMFIMGMSMAILFGHAGDTVLRLIGVTINSIILIYELVMFSQSGYILAEDNTKGIIQCLKESIELMKDNKLRYVGLFLSFIGWFLLLLLVMFILLAIEVFINEDLRTFVSIIVYIFILLIYPYLELTLALFHLKIKKEKAKGDGFADLEQLDYIVDPE